MGAASRGTGRVIRISFSRASMSSTGPTPEARDGSAPASVGDERQALEEAVRVGLGGARQEAQHPLVAAALLRAAQRAPRPPGHRVPPEEGGGGDLHEAHPVVAAAHVGELVREERVELVAVQVGEKAGGQQQARSAAVRPEHRRDAGRHQEDRRDAAQAKACGEAGRAFGDRVGRRLGAGEQATEPREAPGGQQRDREGPGRERQPRGGSPAEPRAGRRGRNDRAGGRAGPA